MSVQIKMPSLGAMIAIHKMLEIKPNRFPLNRGDVLDGTFRELGVGVWVWVVQHAVRNLIFQSVKLVNIGLSRAYPMPGQSWDGNKGGREKSTSLIPALER